MSVGAPLIEESSPLVTKPVEKSTIPAETTTASTTAPTSTLPAVEPAIQPIEPVVPVETAQDEAIVTAVPATEGVLGYKGAPGLLNKFRFVKHFFWFTTEPLTQEGVDAYLKHEKIETAHHNAAWAQETGKGVLFYAKRAEDKATPSGMILLAEATNVTRIGSTDFSFKVGTQTHKFEAASTQEQDSWVVAIEKIVEESTELKADITGRESYKKSIEGFAFAPVIAGSTPAIKSDTPKKSLDATTATNAAVAEPIVKADSSSESSNDDSKRIKEAEKQAKKDAKKERSQSRKRASVFGIFGKKAEEKEIKEEEKAEKKEIKKEEKAEKKAEKEHVKELKKVEAEHKKEEAKAEHDATKAKEAAEAAAIAAAPAAVVPAVEEKEEKHHHKTTDEVVTPPTDKKAKRTSVFGGLFGNKNKVASPSVEKTEKEVAPEVLVKDDIPVVSETAPRIEEPIDTKPIDTAAVTAPVDATDSSLTRVTAAEETKHVEPAMESAVTPRTEKKSFFAGLMKKKEEVKEDKTTEEVAPVTVSEPIAESTPAAPVAVVEPAVETPAKEAEVAKEERPAREKRRTSLFGSLGTLKRKTEKSPEPSSTLAAVDDTKSPETKREKSPLPSKLGGLFRKPSRSAKAELSAAEEGKTETAPLAGATKTSDTPYVTTINETPANATIIEHTGDSKIIGDVIPSELHSTIHDAVTTAPETIETTHKTA